MVTDTRKIRVAIIGGGPSGLFIYKRLVESGRPNLEIDIYEKKGQLGTGMPYSNEGANDEHVTNVSDNEIPTIVTHIAEWIKTAPKEMLEHFNINPEKFNEYKVLPRLLFGEYLSAQFELLQIKAKQEGITTNVHYNSQVHDVIYQQQERGVLVKNGGAAMVRYDYVIICTGHNWPTPHEGVVPGYFDSPYPPSKLALQLNHAVAIRGSSLTAIDAIRTLARHNGTFNKDAHGNVVYHLSAASPEFKIMMHSRGGFLPGIRFHLADSHLSKDSLLTDEQIEKHMKDNDGFLSLDYLFEKDFKDPIKEKNPEFYERIRDMSMEDFVHTMMQLRERLDPFVLFKAEYVEAEKSIKRKESVYWKEMLAILSFAMNYPAKHFSAEDMQRLQKVLMPLISIVIAFVPQNSCRELMAMHDAGVLDIVSVGHDSHIEVVNEGGIVYHYKGEEGEEQAVRYETFVDCIGQPHLSYKQFPFKSLLEQQVLSPARLRFKSGETGRLHTEQNDRQSIQGTDGHYYLNVPGIAINDNFQPLDSEGNPNLQIYMMAVPYMSGYNPDYSGLDFCEAASGRIVKQMFG